VGGPARKTLAALAAGIATALLFAGGAQAALTIAASPGPDSAETCAASPCPNLRSAVGLANVNPGSTIVLAPADYELGLGELHLTAGVTITGAGPATTKLLQTGSGRLIEDAAAGPVTLQGFEVNGGAVEEAFGSGASAVGGGIYSVSKQTLTLREMLLDNNSVLGAEASAVGGSSHGLSGGSGDGGAVFASEGPLVLDHTTVTGNTAAAGEGGEAALGEGGAGGGAAGGGIYVAGAGSDALTIIDSTISANLAFAGTGGQAEEFAGSGGAATGGGVAGLGAEASTIEGSTISGNTVTGGRGGNAVGLKGFGGSSGAARGGGLDLRAGVVENSTIVANKTEGNLPGTGNTAGGEILSPIGGGLYVSLIKPVTLASDTFSANVADPAQHGSGGNLFNGEGSLLVIRDTILTAGSAQAESTECFGNVTDGGHNLVSSVSGQCGGLGAGAGDLIGANPLLGPLAENGGPTQTLALGAGSPALSAGGACTDPLAGEAPLLLDQRGLPRTGVCDIGAFQHEPPVAVAAPALEGVPAVGKTLSCARGTWSGDAPLTFAYRWLRDGSAIAGASATAYTVAPADAGHAIACEVSASNTYATVAARSATASIPPSPSSPPAPTLTAVSESHRTWREGTRLASLARARRHAVPVGTTIRFTLNTAATISIDFTRPAGGRRVGGHCVAPSRHNRRARRCTRDVAAGTLALGTVGAGTHAISFQGRLTRARRLRPGSYGLLLSATSAQGAAHAAALAFTIVAG
jgi:hypothetical protein